MDDRAAEILGAALKLFWERGYHGTSVRQISKEAETAVANVYHYYPRKLDLLNAIIDDAQDTLQRNTEAGMASAPDDPLSQLRAVVSAHVRFHVENQRESFVGNSELRSLPEPFRKRYIAKRDAQQALFERPVQAGIEAGVFRTKIPQEAVLGMITMCTSVSLWYRPDGELSPDEVVERMTHLAIRMVEPVGS